MEVDTLNPDDLVQLNVIRNAEDRDSLLALDIEITAHGDFDADDTAYASWDLPLYQWEGYESFDPYDVSGEKRMRETVWREFIAPWLAAHGASSAGSDGVEFQLSQWQPLCT